MKENNNWKKSDERAEIAKKHIREMEQKYSKEIEFSVENTIEYPHYPHKEKIIIDFSGE